MNWKGKELRSTQDYVGALYRIATREEAGEFRGLLADEIGELDADREIGYLTGYMDRASGPRARDLFGVEHPVIGDLGQCTPDELLNLGMAFKAARLAGKTFDQAATVARAAVRTLRQVRGNGGA